MPQPQSQPSWALKYAALQSAVFQPAATSSAVVVGYEPPPAGPGALMEGAKIVDAPSDGETVAARAERKLEVSGGENPEAEPLLPSALGATQLSFGQVSPFMHPYTKDPGMAQSGSDAPHWQSQPSFAFQYDGEHVHSEGGTLPEGVASYCPFGASPITYSLEVGAVPMTACRSRLRPKLVLPDLRLFALPLFGS